MQRTLWSTATSTLARASTSATTSSCTHANCARVAANSIAHFSTSSSRQLAQTRPRAASSRARSDTARDLDAIDGRPTRTRGSAEDLKQLVQDSANYSSDLLTTLPSGQSLLSYQSWSTLFVTHAALTPISSDESNLDELSSGTILRHLSNHQVISPRHLSPQHLLQPRLPRPDLSLAYPLGPPVSEANRLDSFVRLQVDPLKDGVLNTLIKTRFTTSMGKIEPRGNTLLQRKSQRKVAKAIRRARSMGVMPYFGQQLPSDQRRR
ncbi:hypothetical protein ACM66B_001035 [Microbotryomycetes sp. NB124-2]